MAKTAGNTRGGIKYNESGETTNAAIENYVSGDGMWINQYLRGTFDSTLDEDERRYLNSLDKATAKELGKDMTLYRSVDASAIFGGISELEYENLRDHLVYGDNQRLITANAQKAMAKMRKSFTEKGFMSTSRSQSVVDEWGGFSGADMPVVLKMQVGRNTKGVDISKHRMAQGEVILARGQKLRLGRVYGKNGNIYIEATI